MKKYNYLLSISVIALLLLLCPSFSNAQKGTRKVKNTSAKVKKQSKTSMKTTAVTSGKNKPITAKINGADKPRSSEPTEGEMKEALLNAMAERGGRRKGDDTIEINNPLNSSIVKIEQFEKLGCTPVTGNIGFSCTYKATTSLSVRSNEGTSSGDRHAEAWNTLLGGLGAKYTIATATKRFVRSKNGWTALSE